MHWFGVDSVFWDVIIGIGALVFLIFVIWLIIWWAVHDKTVYFHHSDETKTTKLDETAVSNKFKRIKTIMKREEE